MLENAGKIQKKDFNLVNWKIQKIQKLDFWICWKMLEKMLEKSKKSKTGFFFAGKMKNNQKKSNFGLILMEKIQRWIFSHFSSIYFSINYDDTFLLYIYLYIFHILYFFS